ncbi:Hypothetical predicted protein [Pelobates cultripes]|uniref:Uncharacterized protein n=1 Tax=Pelobates cultripes TaxID=61616 RepID=A0AAD1T4Y0_PELCU|nr:Hypothetical predicted protein [Pelobates cultripes]
MADQINLFGPKAAHFDPAALTDSQDGRAFSEDHNPASKKVLWCRQLTTTYLQEAMDLLSSKLIVTWSYHMELFRKCGAYEYFQALPHRL